MVIFFRDYYTLRVRTLEVASTGQEEVTCTHVVWGSLFTIFVNRNFENERNPIKDLLPLSLGNCTCNSV